MKINIKKGFFRLWVIATMGWLIVASMLFLPATKKELNSLATPSLFEKTFNAAKSAKLGGLEDRKREIWNELKRRKLVPEIEFEFPSKDIFDEVYYDGFMKEKDFEKAIIHVSYLGNKKTFAVGENSEKIYLRFEPIIEQKRRDIYLNSLLILIGPSIALFIFGCLIFWVFKGFKEGI